MVPFGSKLPKSKSSKGLSPANQQRNKLTFETLERREMLAADMAPRLSASCELICRAMAMPAMMSW